MGWQDAPEDTPTPAQGSQPAWMSAPLEPTSAGQSQQLPDPSWRDRLNAFEGGVLRGGAYLAGMVPDAVANVGSLGVSSYDLARHALFGTPWSELPRPWQPSPVGVAITQQLDKSPITTTQLTRPDDAVSRYLSVAGSVLPAAASGSGGSLGGLARVTAGALPSALTGQAVAEAKPFGDSDWENAAASGLAQLATGYGLPAVSKGVIRGADPDELQANLSAFNDAGAQPSLGQAAGTRRMQYLESTLAKIPGGAGVFNKFATQQAADLRAGAQDTISSLSNEVSPEAAGEAITHGITGPGGAVEQFRNQSRALFNAVDQHIPGERPVSVDNTVSALDRLTSPIPGAENVSATLVNPKVTQIRDAILSDLTNPDNPGSGTTLPYRALSGVRSQVGDLIGGNELISGVPRAQLKQLYGALSQDMEGAAQSAGPDAANAWNQAQDFYRTGIARMDQLDSLVNRQGGPEAVFKSAMAGTDYGASKLRTILDSVAPDQRNTVAATVLDRMGRATPGAQNAEGTIYSPQAYLTNWARMSPEAKSALFGDQGTSLRDNLENAASVAQNIKDGSKVFANASGTAGANNQSELFKHAISLATGALVGHGAGPGGILGAGVGFVGAPAAAYGLSRAMTSPTTINWAGRPAFGSASQFASGAAAPGNMDQQRRLRIALGLEPFGLQQGQQ